MDSNSKVIEQKNTTILKLTLILDKLFLVLEDFRQNLNDFQKSCTERILCYFLGKLDSRIVKVTNLRPSRHLYYYNSGIVNNPRIVFLNHFMIKD